LTHKLFLISFTFRSFLSVKLFIQFYINIVSKRQQVSVVVVVVVVVVGRRIVVVESVVGSVVVVVVVVGVTRARESLRCEEDG